MKVNQKIEAANMKEENFEKRFLQRDSPSYPAISLEDLHDRTLRWQLKSTLPEDIQRLWKTTMDLYTFGYYRYQFFTVAEHYAYVTLEAAIKTRYSQNLPTETKVECKKNPNKHFTIKNPTWQKIYTHWYKFWREKGWQLRETLVDGKLFPHSVKKLVQYLIENRLVDEKESNLILNCWDLRHSLAHQEFSPVHIPPTKILEKIHQLINMLFEAD